MTKIRSLIAFLIFLFICFSTVAQTTKQPIALKEAFTKIEAQFPVLFSFQDAALETHIITYLEKTSLKETLAYLTKESLFNFELIDANTVAVFLKKATNSVCLAIKNYKSSNTYFLVQTPFQKITNNKNENFNLLTNSTTLSVSIIAQGYEESSINLSLGKTCERIVLVQQINELPPIMISNYFIRGISKNENGSVAINYEDFDILPGLIEADVLQTIKALPGIQSVNESVSNINIRGGTNDQNLMLWDGIKMYQSGHFFGLISAFNPYATQKVNIIKNGTTASYGDGVSGVIAMEGSDEITNKASFGTALNLLSIDGFATIPLNNKLNVHISGRRSVSDLLETPTYSQYFDKAFQNTEVLTSQSNNESSNEDFLFYDTNFRVIYQPTTKDFFRVSALIVGNNLSFLESAIVDNNATSRNSDLNQSNLAAGLFYKRKWNEKWNTQFQFSASNYSLEAINVDILNNQQLRQENRLTETNFKAQNFNSLTQDISTSFGYQFNETGITNFENINNPFFQRTETQVLRTNSLFAEIAMHKETAQFDMTFGIRANHISKFNDVLFEPRMAIKKRFLKYFAADILGEYKSQTTSQIIDFQNDFLGVENRRWILSNPDEIPILKSKQISAGISYSRSGWLLNAEGYIKNVAGITSQSQGFQNQFKNEKTTGEYMVKGMELLATKSFKNYSSWLSYTYADNTYNFSEFSPSVFHNNLDIEHTITYGINYTLQQFKFSGGINWHSGKPTTLLVAGNELVDGELNFNLPNGSIIDDYFRVDVSATYSFKISEKLRAVAGVSIWNLLNKENNIDHFFVLNEENGFQEIDEKALRFTPNASLKIFF